MGKYESVIQYVFERKAEKYGMDAEIPFDRDDLETALNELDITVKNVPDIPYAYRSRRSLPEEIAEHGYNAVVIDDTRTGADATYLFTKREQLIPIPDSVDETRTADLKGLPRPVRPYISRDEQGVLTQVRYAGLLDEFTELTCYHLQSHLRMRVNRREAELDDLYLGVDSDDTHHAIAIEAKGARETLNRNQLVRNTRGIEADETYPDSVRTLAVKLHDDGAFYLFEFEILGAEDRDTVETRRVWRYEFQG